MIKAYLIVLINISASGVATQAIPLDSMKRCYTLQKVYSDMEHGAIRIESRCINPDNWGQEQ